MYYAHYFLTTFKGLLAGATLVLLSIILFSPFSEPRTETVFVYGTLTNPIIRTYACWCLSGSTPATLADYKKEGLTIIPKPGSQVNGQLITLSETELARVDRYESVPDNYKRFELSTKNTSLWVYIKN